MGEWLGNALSAPWAPVWAVAVVAVVAVVVGLRWPPRGPGDG